MEAKRKARFERKGWSYKPRTIKEPGLCEFKNPSAMFLVGSRGRDASFLKEGVVSLWTTAGRKKIAYALPEAFRQTFKNAVEIDSLTVIERNGRLYGRMVVTLDAPEPKAAHPIGVDLGETNALVAVNPDDGTFFVSGKENKVRGKRICKTRKRLQRKLAFHKAQKKDTRSLRRLLKRLGRKNSNRTRSFCQESAKKLCDFAGADSVLVFEDLSIPQPMKGIVASKAASARPAENKAKGKALRRRLSLWQYGMMLQHVRNRAERDGIAVALVNPAFTSQNCSRCGLRGKRKRHKFLCPHCGFSEHADINAAMNIRDRFTVLRDGGPQSIGPEALENALVADSEGKLSPSGDSR